MRYVHVLNLHHFAKHLGHIWIMCTQVDHFAMHVVHMWTMCLELHQHQYQWLYKWKQCDGIWWVWRRSSPVSLTNHQFVWNGHMTPFMAGIWRHFHTLQNMFLLQKIHRLYKACGTPYFLCMACKQCYGLDDLDNQTSCLKLEWLHFVGDLIKAYQLSKDA